MILPPPPDQVRARPIRLRAVRRPEVHFGQLVECGQSLARARRDGGGSLISPTTAVVRRIRTVFEDDSPAWRDKVGSNAARLRREAADRGDRPHAYEILLHPVEATIASLLDVPPPTELNLRHWLATMRHVGGWDDPDGNVGVLPQLDLAQHLAPQVVMCVGLDEFPPYPDRSSLLASFPKEVAEGMVLLASLTGARQRVILSAKNGELKRALRSHCRNLDVRLQLVHNVYPSAHPTMVLWTHAGKRLRLPAEGNPAELGVMVVTPWTAIRLARWRANQKLDLLRPLFVAAPDTLRPLTGSWVVPGQPLGDADEDLRTALQRNVESVLIGHPMTGVPAEPADHGSSSKGESQSKGDASGDVSDEVSADASGDARSGSDGKSAMDAADHEQPSAVRDGGADRNVDHRGEVDGEVDGDGDGKQAYGVELRRRTHDEGSRRRRLGVRPIPQPDASHVNDDSEAMADVEALDSELQARSASDSDTGGIDNQVKGSRHAKGSASDRDSADERGDAGETGDVDVNVTDGTDGGDERQINLATPPGRVDRPEAPPTSRSKLPPRPLEDPLEYVPTERSAGSAEPSVPGISERWRAAAMLAKGVEESVWREPPVPSHALMVSLPHLTTPPSPQACIACGWCVEVCPTMLRPAHLLELAQGDPADAELQRSLDFCIQCGLCSYICPSALPLAQTFNAVKRNQSIVANGAPESESEDE